MGTPRICGVFLYTILKKYHAYGYIKKSDAGRSTGRLPWWSRGYIKWLWMAAGRPQTVGAYHHQTTQHITIYYNCIGAFSVSDRRNIPATQITMGTRKGVAVSYSPERIAV